MRRPPRSAFRPDPFARAGVLALLGLAAQAIGAAAAQGHELRPALLSLTETEPDGYDVLWRAPIASTVLLAPVPVFPAGTERIGGEERTRARDMEVQRFSVRIPGGLGGRRLGVRFARSGETEVLVRVATRDGRTLTGRLTAGGEDWLVPLARSRRAVAQTYLRLGVTHIVTGFDHLAFLLALVLLAPAWRNLWKTITAFTLAHSLTLALASLWPVPVPAAPAQATIALSILFVAREAALASQGRPSPGSPRHPWVIALAFGLLHGLGFAGALAEVGLPETNLRLALFTFNLGLELSQLWFVAIILLLGRPLGRLLVGRLAWLRLGPTYAVGALGAFLSIARVAAFW